MSLLDLLYGSIVEIAQGAVVAGCWTLLGWIVYRLVSGRPLGG